MSLNPKDFNATLLTGDKPEAHTGQNEFTTIKLKYGGNAFNFFVPPPGVLSSAISDNPKKPNQLSQGFKLETPELLNFAKAASDRIVQILFEHKDDPNMPSFCNNWTAPEDIERNIRLVGGNFKTLVHYPKKRDSNGKPTNEIDTEVTPMMYCKMIQAGPNPRNKDHKPWQIFTKYYSAAILAPHNKAALNSGQKQESEFLYDPVNMMKRKLKMRFMPSVTASDIFVASGKIIVRIAISEAYILKFEETESQARKNIGAAVLASGIDLSGPGSMPEPQSEEDDGESVPLPESKEFEVVIDGN